MNWSLDISAHGADLFLMLCHSEKLVVPCWYIGASTAPRNSTHVEPKGASGGEARNIGPPKALPTSNCVSAIGYDLTIEGKRQIFDLCQSVSSCTPTCTETPESTIACGTTTVTGSPGGAYRPVECRIMALGFAGPNSRGRPV